MVLVTIESVPVDTEVMIDGVPADWVSASLVEFRSVCMTGDVVSCDWDVLKGWLEDHRVSGFWWELTTSERRAVAIKTIKNTEGLYQQFGSWSHGASDCGGSDGVWNRAVCLHNALCRYLKFQSPLGIAPYPESIDSCYYRYYMDGIVNQCYRHDRWYDLPGHYVTCGSATYGHFMASIQVNQDTSSMNSWIVFQYRDVDIKPGSRQMPFDTTVLFSKVTHARCDGVGCDRVATFEV